MVVVFDKVMWKVAVEDERGNEFFDDFFLTVSDN
jgi:hypothetical protein